MILIVWALSFLVSIAPLLGWKDPGWNDRLHVERQCIVSQDVSYQIFATASSFYVPLLVILFLYWRIFLTARKRIRRRQQVRIRNDKLKERYLKNMTKKRKCIKWVVIDLLNFGFTLHPFFCHYRYLLFSFLFTKMSRFL